jgi:hypothetical protein
MRINITDKKQDEPHPAAGRGVDEHVKTLRSLVYVIHVDVSFSLPIR